MSGSETNRPNSDADKEAVDPAGGAEGGMSGGSAGGPRRGDTLQDASDESVSKVEKCTGGTWHAGAGDIG